jgi:hypothetical protein
MSLSHQWNLTARTDLFHQADLAEAAAVQAGFRGHHQLATRLRTAATTLEELGADAGPDLNSATATCALCGLSDFEEYFDCDMRDPAAVLCEDCDEELTAA